MPDTNKTAMRMMIVGMVFFFLSCVVAIGIGSAKTASCEMHASATDGAGKKVKGWYDTARNSCYLFGLGCNLSCERWCDADRDFIVAAEKHDIPINGAALVSYSCQMKTENAGGGTQLKEGRVSLR